MEPRLHARSPIDQRSLFGSDQAAGSGHVCSLRTYAQSFLHPSGDRREQDLQVVALVTDGPVTPLYPRQHGHLAIRLNRRTRCPLLLDGRLPPRLGGALIGVPRQE